MTKIYMYLPKGEKLEDQMKEYAGNAIYYSKQAVLKALAHHKQNTKAMLEDLKDKLASLEPLKDQYPKEYLAVKKELANIKVHKITDYVELEVHITGIGRLQKPTKVKKPKEMN